MLVFRRYSVGILCCAFALMSHSAAAQFSDASQPNTRGFFMKFSGGWSAFHADSLAPGTDHGLGTSLGIGLGFTPNVALVFDGGTMFFRGGQIDKYHFDHFDLGVRVHFPREEQRLVPYADLTVSGIFLRKDSVAMANAPAGRSLAGKHDIDCSCFSASAGLLFFVTSKWALDANAHWSVGSFKTTTAGSPIEKPNLALSSQMVRLNFGIAWYPDTAHFRPRGLAGLRR